MKMENEHEDDENNLEEIESYTNCCLKNSLRWFGTPLCKIKNSYCKYSGSRDEETGLNCCMFYYTKRKKSK